jgi:hypothetical protein
LTGKRKSSAAHHGSKQGHCEFAQITNFRFLDRSHAARSNLRSGRTANFLTAAQIIQQRNRNEDEFHGQAKQDLR